jgi:hypothetical protein
MFGSARSGAWLRDRAAAVLTHERQRIVLLTMVFMCLGGFVTLAGIAAYWMYRPLSGIMLKHDPVTVLTPVVHQDGSLRYRIAYCVDDRIPLPVTVSRELELQGRDTETYALSTLSYVITQRCEEWTRVVRLPRDITPGVYHLHLYTAIQANPLRVLQQVFQTQDFRVVD